MRVSERFLNLALISGMLGSAQAQSAPPPPCHTGPYVGFTQQEANETVAHALQSIPIKLPNWVPAEGGISGPAIHSLRQWLTAKEYTLQSNAWLRAQVHDVAGQMGASSAVPMIVMFVKAPKFNAEAQMKYLSQKDGTNLIILAGVVVSSASLDRLTVKDLKILLAHEVRHFKQDPKQSATWREHDADLAAAKLYGPQAVIDVFEKLRGFVEDNIPNDPHGNLTSRQQAIRQAFCMGDPKPKAVAAIKPVKAVVR